MGDTLEVECKNKAAAASRFESKVEGWSPSKDDSNYDLIHVLDGASAHLKLACNADWVVAKLANPIGQYDIVFSPIQCNDGDTLEITGNDVNAYLYQNGKQVASI